MMKTLPTRFVAAMIKFIFILTLSSITLLGSLPATAREALPEPNWSLAMAREAAGRVEKQSALKLLFQLAREGDEDQLLQELMEIEHRSDWPVPAREHTLHAFASGLGDLPARSVGPGVFAYLDNYQSRTLVPHSDHPMAGIPLYNIRSAATGSANEWRRQAAAARAKTLLESGGEAWLDAYLTATPPQRKGFEDALGSVSAERMLEVAQLSLKHASQDPSMAAVAAQSALHLSDPILFQQAISAGRGPGLAEALRQASAAFSDRENLSLLEYSIEHAPSGNSALAIALLAPARLDQADMAELMFQTLDNQKVGSAAALVLSASADPEIHRRLANLASDKNNPASRRAALAISNRQADLAGEQR
jgi:hypothetical protein